MTKLIWDEAGSHLYEAGTRMVVLYPRTGSGYGNGVAWNGVTGITEKPSGAEETKLYAGDAKYLSLRSAEEFAATLSAYTYPDEWAACDGSKELKPGVRIGMQNRTGFGLCYRTIVGNDTEGEDFGYKLHLVYGCLAAPSEKAYASINDSPEATTFSWEISTTPVAVTGARPTATLTIDSTQIDSTKLALIEKSLYGDATTEPTLLLPDAIVALIGE